METKEKTPAKPDYKNAVLQASSLIRRAYLTKPPVVAEELAGLYNLRVVYADFNIPNFPLKGVSGFINIAIHTMFVNSNEDQKRQNFTIAHELGHYILGHTSTEQYGTLFRKNAYERENDPLEKEANCFAANLLVPQSFLQEVIAKYPFATDRQLGNIFGVSDMVIRSRKAWLGVV